MYVLEIEGDSSAKRTCQMNNFQEMEIISSKPMPVIFKENASHVRDPLFQVQADEGKVREEQDPGQGRQHPEEEALQGRQAVNSPNRLHLTRNKVVFSHTYSCPVALYIPMRCS